MATIVSINCQHGFRLRWSRTNSGYVPLDKDHKKESSDCKPQPGRDK